MTEKIHALQPMLDALHIKQTISFDDCSLLFREVANKTGALPPPFELSGNQWCALVNLAIARFAIPPAPQRTWVGLTPEERADLIFIGSSFQVAEAIEAKLKEKNT
jgi:hypothetical protein